jgi:tetratricopeptide (TPR) repeat protein
MARAGAERIRFALATLLLTATAYSPALRGGFVWDDRAHILENPHLETFDGLARIWSDPRAIAGRQNYPLTFTAFWLERHLWGIAPFGYHLVNVLLHAANALLLWRVLGTLGVPACWFAAAVFALHPVAVESVAWVSEQKNTLSGFLYLSSLTFYVRSARTLNRSYVLSIAFFALALLAKTITCSLPVVLLLVSWYRSGRLTRADLARSIPFFVLAAWLSAGTAEIERDHVKAIGPEWDFSFVERTEIASRAFWFYIGKIAWPFGNTFIYPRFKIDGASFLGFVLGGGAAAVLAALFLLHGRLGRGPFAALSFYTVTVAPALGFFNIYPFRYSFVADHFQYLACIGTIVLFTSAIMRLASRNGLPAWALSGPLLALLAVLTFLQSRAYAGPVALWEHTLRGNPSAWIAHNNLGNEMRERGDLDRARRHLDKAHELAPNVPEILMSLGLLHTRRGDRDAARSSYEQLIELPDGRFLGHVGLGETLAREGDWEGALSHFENATRLAPNDARSWSGAGEVYLNTGLLVEAVAALRRAVTLEPRNVFSRVNLGLALVRLGRAQEAEEHLRAALAVTPGAPGASATLGTLLALQKRYAEAWEAFDQALRANRRDGLALAGLARLALETGEEARAIRLGRALVDADPANGEAHLFLARLYQHLGDRVASSKHAARAAELGLPVEPALREPAAKPGDEQASEGKDPSAATGDAYSTRHPGTP